MTGRGMSEERKKKVYFWLCSCVTVEQAPSVHAHRNQSTDIAGLGG